MATIYLDRDNAITLGLKIDGGFVNAGIVTRAQVWLPPSASVAGTAVMFDTMTDPDAELVDSDTAVRIRGGQRDLKPGRYQAYVTVYDNQSPNGIAWATQIINIQQWQPDV